MSYRVRLLLLSSVSLAALAAGSIAAQAADTVCNGSMTGAISGNLVVPAGAACTLYQANVSGNVQVLQNASLTVDGLEEWSSIGGNVQANQCASTLLEGSVTVGGNVQIQNCTGTSGFAGPGIKIHGNFQCQNNQGACEATLGEVSGNAQIQGNRAVTAGDISLDVIGGNLQCQGEHFGADACSGRRVGPRQPSRPVCGVARLCRGAILMRQPDRVVAAGYDDLVGPGLFGGHRDPRHDDGSGLVVPGGRQHHAQHQPGA